MSASTNSHSKIKTACMWCYHRCQRGKNQVWAASKCDSNSVLLLPALQWSGSGSAHVAPMSEVFTSLYLGSPLPWHPRCCVACSSFRSITTTLYHVFGHYVHLKMSLRRLLCPCCRRPCAETSRLWWWRLLAELFTPEFHALCRSQKISWHMGFCLSEPQFKFFVCWTLLDLIKSVLKMNACFVQHFGS